MPHADCGSISPKAWDRRRNLQWHIAGSARFGELIEHFHKVASEGTAEEALAAFYAYESQVPRIAREKERGLREMYGADDKTCGYFALHTTADVHHSNVWRTQLKKRVEAQPENGGSCPGRR